MERPLRVLLIEEDAESATTIEDMLRDEPAPARWEVVRATQVADGLGFLGASSFDLALVRLAFGDGSGLRACDDLLTSAPGVALVALVDDDGADAGVAAVRRGVQDVLVRGRLDGASLRRTLRYAIERQRLLHQLRSQSLIDPLTGLYNRRGFDTVGGQQLRVARRSGKGAFCIFCDIDDLKAINDVQGHRAGDEALRIVAAALQDALRRSDVVARLAGDEFAALGIETGGAYEQDLLVRIQEAVVERTRLASLSFGIDVTLGLARTEANDSASLGDVLDDADRAMYAARAAVVA